MKLLRHLNILCLLALAANITYGQDSKNEKQAKKEAEIKNLIDSQNFVFKAQTAFPLGASSRQLNYDYDLKVTKESLVSYLPYFGRAYSSTPGSTNGLDFTSKDFEYTVTETKKSDGWDVVIKPKDTQLARELLLTAFKNGTANLQVNSNDKQSISYSGYLTANKSKKQ